MSVKWEKQEGNEGVLTVTVDAETVKKGIDSAFNKVVKTVNVPGFRKGKIPRPIFEQRFGVESLYQDALDFILPDAYAAAVEEAGIDPIDRPEIDIEQMEKGKELIFTAKVQVKPEVKLGDYKGLEVEKPDTSVSDADVEEELKSLQERHAELVIKEDGEAKEGDTVVMDFEGFSNGEPFEGGQSDNYSLEIGSGNFIPGFEDGLVGVKTGDKKDIEVTFPEEYHAAELAGQPAMFKVTVHEIKAKELPELNDDFAKDTDEAVETLDALKEKIRTRLEESKKAESEQVVRDSLVEQATEGTEVIIPEVMVESELNRMMQEFEQRLQSQGMNLELYYQFSGQAENELREQMKEDASGRVRTNLTLEAIANAENIVISDEEADKELNDMATAYNMPVDSIKQALGGSDALKADLRIRKAVELLFENSKEKAQA
jgi:trigger factor